MKPTFLLLMTLLFLGTASAQEVSLIEVSGRVTDQEKHEPLSDVSIQIKGTVQGTITNRTGEFVLRTKTKLPFTLVFLLSDLRSRSLR
ncbi:carboxypeptidase-like regulatory domain-containing protein [Paraflavitalea speifideaquila]|uniref:carboxypeptidase-like regulatory domain-containing protein n=1 Tax=Paraflavitalea speifideaquila TaxID=3076558 RepID=UPI0028EF51B2|nr:carboxypeptidase-like regulatory domain-containing protein [Paraflavitalea speifideiaquila]